MDPSRLIYDKLTDDDDGFVCDEIPDEACRDTPKNFVLILLAYFLTKLGDAIASPKTTLAWVTTAVGAPAYVLGFLVPVRESGSLIPQLFIGGMVRSLAVRKWVWVAGGVLQGIAVVGIGLVVMVLTGVTAGWAILGLIAVFAVARSFCSVAAKDVIGKTIPKTKRGQLTGWSASAAGLLTVVIGLALLLPALQDADASVYGLLLIAAGGLWFLATLVYSGIGEHGGDTSGTRDATESLKALGLLLTDRPFRRFVITRALLMCSALSAPFYIALAQEHLGSPSYILGLFLAAGGVASLISAPVWGRFADQSSKRVMIAAAAVTAGAGILTFVCDRYLPAISRSAWFLPAAYFVLSVAHSGVRVGRKTYVVDLASGNRRTDYVAISNSVIGVLLLIAGSVGALAPIISNAGVIALLASMGVAGAVLGLSLPEVEN